MNLTFCQTGQNNHLVVNVDRLIRTLLTITHERNYNAMYKTYVFLVASPTEARTTSLSSSKVNQLGVEEIKIKRKNCVA